MSELAAAKASSDASERCAITFTTAATAAAAAAAAATSAAAAAAVTVVSTADCSKSIGSWRAGIDLSAHLAHHVAVVGEESSMLGATSVLPHGGVGDRQGVVVEGDEGGLGRRCVARALDGGDLGHHHVEVLAQVVLAHVAALVDGSRL